ncbi:ribonuclease H-like domain-containing protein [Tanacetum coccineum]
MAVLESCPKHNMVAYLEKTEGNAEFHEIIDFLTRSSIHHALTVSPVVSTTFVEQFWTSAKSKIINNVRHITAKVAGKPVSISEASIRSDLLFDDANGIDSLPNQAIFDAIQLMGYKGDLTGKHFFGKVTPLFASMLVQPTEDEGAPSERPSEAQPTPSPTHTSEVPLVPQNNDPSPTHTSEKALLEILEVSDQAKEIQHLKAHIKKLKKQAKPVVKHHRAMMKVSPLKNDLARRDPQEILVHKESISNMGRKFTKVIPSVHKDPLFDKIPEDTSRLYDDEVLKMWARKEFTDKEKVSTDRPKVSTDRQKDSTDEQNEGTDDQNEGTDEQSKGTDEHTEEGRATQPPQPPTSTIFGDDETIAQVLLNMSQAKAVSREKEKGVEFKDIEETKRPRPTSTRSLLTLKPLPKIDPKDKGKKKIEEEDESDGIPEAEKKFKQLASDEEMARKVQEEWEGEEERKRLDEEEATNEALIRNYDDIKARIEADRLLAEKLQEEEREQFTIEERAKFLHDTIAAQRKFLAQQESDASGIHSDLKTKKFEDIQALYEKIKRSDEDFISIEYVEDERMIKKMNEKGIDSSKNEVVKEEDKEEEDSEIMEKKSVIARLNKVSSPDGDYLVIYRANGNFRAFNYLMEVLHIFDRQDLFHLYDLIRDQFSEVTLDGFELILWGDLKIMMESSTEGNEQSDF